MLRLRSHYTNSRKQKSIHTKHTALRADIISHLQAQSMRKKSDSVSDDFRNKKIQTEMVMSELKCLSFLILFSFLLFASNLVSYLCSSLSYLILLIFLPFSLFHSCSTSFTFLFLRIVLLLQCPDRKVTVRIWNGYSQHSVRLHTRRWGDRGSILGRNEDFSSSLCVQTGSEAHPASCTMGTGGGVLSPWVNRGRGVTLTAHPL
jgi:hypothetical protein